MEGVEVAEASQPIADFRVYTQEFDKIPVYEPSYDAVTAWAVMEHVHDPMAYFRKAGEVVKKGGLFVLLVQNFESLASRYLFCEDVPRHLYFFYACNSQTVPGEDGIRPGKRSQWARDLQIGAVQLAGIYVADAIVGERV